MTHQIEALEDEIEDLIEENTCLRDDVQQAKAELQEYQKERGRVESALAEFLCTVDKGVNLRHLQQLAVELRQEGFRYEVLSCQVPNARGSTREFQLIKEPYPERERCAMGVDVGAGYAMPLTIPNTFGKP